MARKLLPPLMNPLSLLGAATDRLIDRVSPEGNRAIPAASGGEPQGALQYARADMYTLFTTTLGASQPFFTADQWVKVKLLLETAGPVAVGTRSQITPVLAGKGLLLTTDVPFEIFLPRGTILYYAAESLNRVNVTVEPIPWAQQLSGELRLITSAVGKAASAIVEALRQRAGQSAPPPPIAPPPVRPASKIARLTKITLPERMG